MPHDYSDTLRALGRFLEEEGATGVKIVDAGDHLSVSWQGREGAPMERGYRSFELEDLRLKSRLMRAADEGTPQVSTSEILRLLGWALDHMGADLISMIDTPAGLRLTAIVGGRRAARTYQHDELVELVEAQRKGRGFAQSPLSARSIGPLPEV